MKKLIFISLAIIAMLTVSCTTDYTDPAKLSGTTWRCSTFTDANMAAETEYIELKFTSTTAVEVWGKNKDVTAVEKQETYSYKISDKTISLFLGSQTTATTTGTIDGKNMSFINEGKTKDPKRAFAICNGLYEDGKLVDLIKLIDDNTK